MINQTTFSLPAFPRGFHLITREVSDHLPDLPNTGILHLFLKHTSAGLTINENADPSVRTDFESIFNKLVPENMPFLEHTLEGPDDMPAHIKTALTDTSLTIPITNGRLNLGTWQGIYLCEFRNRGGSRRLVATVIGG
jgi:secondary thiamine-phosphate synthase enzyme